MRSAAIEIRFNIAGIVLALRSTDGLGDFAIPESYQRFLTDESPHVHLAHQVGDIPDLVGWFPVFDTGGVWKLWRKEQRWAITLSSPVIGPNPYQIAIFSEDFTSGEIYTAPAFPPTDQVAFPLGYPLAEVLMINLLSRERGVLLHACGLVDGENGLLFSGVSGAGKSTTTRLWENQLGVAILSDDRVILREQGGQFWMHGSPWHGDAHAALPRAVLLKYIFVLEHAQHNQAKLLGPAELATRLFVRSFPTFWNAAGMQYTLRLLDELAQAVPGYELGFVPDASAVEFVRCLSAAKL